MFQKEITIKTPDEDKSIVRSNNTQFNSAQIYKKLQIDGPLNDVSSLDIRIMEQIRRMEYITNYGFSVPTENTIDFIHDVIVEAGGNCMSLGSGDTALVESLLSSYEDIDIIAIDNFSSDGSELMREPFNSELMIVNSDARTAIANYPKCNTYMLVWPSYENDMAYDALLEIESKSRNSADKPLIIYWGENIVECDVNQKLIKHLNENWQEYLIHVPRQWTTLHDKIYVYKWKQ